MTRDAEAALLGDPWHPHSPAQAMKPKSSLNAAAQPKSKVPLLALPPRTSHVTCDTCHVTHTTGCAACCCSRGAPLLHVRPSPHTLHICSILHIFPRCIFVTLCASFAHDNIVRMNSLMTESFFTMMLPQKSDQRVRQCPVLHHTSSACVGATFACYSLVPLLVFACYIIALHLCLPFVTEGEEGGGVCLTCGGAGCARGASGAAQVLQGLRLVRGKGRVEGDLICEGEGEGLRGF